MTDIPCPPGIRSRLVHDVNGLAMHVLEAGFEDRDRPCVLMLHGFPELAYSWRKVMPAIADAGYHVVAPDQRGYGWTTGWDGDYDGDVESFRLLNLVRDALRLVAKLDRRSVVAVVGHDFGSPVAACCALARPDVFRSVVLMSAPFPGPPEWPSAAVPEAPLTRDVHADLAALSPPRKHYQWYYSTRAANDDMWHCPQGVHDFLRAYYHMKSADWAQNEPFPLEAWRADELAKLPNYYIMELDKDMAATVAPEMPSAEAIAACPWLSEDELRVYSSTFARTGFQGGLQWYRCTTEGRNATELGLFAGRAIDVPCCFVAGRSDWGIHQKPGDLVRMQKACTRMTGCHLIDGAGHWVQQERPVEVSRLLVDFLRATGG